MSDARTQAPASCANCRHWSEYIAGLGECLEYVVRRQEAFRRAEDMLVFHHAWPRRAAVDTVAAHVCDRHKRAPADA